MPEKFGPPAITRRSFVARTTAGLVTVGAATSSANAQLVYKASEWNIAEFDRLVNHPSRLKQVFDENRIGGGRFLNNVKNSLNGLHFGFNLPSTQVKIVVAMHGPANALNFDDYAWQKYRLGEWLNVEDLKAGKSAVRNPFYSEQGGAADAVHDARPR